MSKMIKNPDTEKKIAELIGRMTREEKIGQLNQVFSPLDSGDNCFELIKKGLVGTFLIANSAHAGNDESKIAPIDFLNEVQRVAVEESRLGIPILFGRDVIHGHHTVLPLPLNMSASFNDTLVRECYRDIAEEAYNDGVRWSFAPMLDLSRDPRWGRCVEGCGEDPYLASKMGAAVIEGFQGSSEDKARVMACAKHYVGYGATEGGRDYHHCEITENSLRNYYLPAFKEAVEAGVMSVMTAFNEIGGVPVTADEYLVRGVLKNEFGFEGFTVSDYEAIKQLIDMGVASDRKNAAEQAFTAGVDVDMLDGCYIDYISELIDEGTVSESLLDDAVARILRAKFSIGLFDNPYIEPVEYSAEAHQKRALSLAEESIVLLKNNGVLPIGDSASIAVVGPFVNEKKAVLGSWSLDSDPEKTVTLGEGIGRAFKSRASVQGNTLYDDALLLCDRNDISVICLGESQWMNGEANSEAEITLPSEQTELLKKAKMMGKKTVAVLCFGKPRALGEAELYCDAIVYAGHLGGQIGTAVANVLKGTVNPSGHLTMTVPRVTGQIPMYYNVLSSGRPVNGYYGRQVDYGNYHDVACTPLYPFGFGLSYTEFEIKNAELCRTEIGLAELEKGEKITLNVEVTNKGGVYGKTVVQLYVKDNVASVARPLRELRGYKKVGLSAGETEKIEFSLGFKDFAFYNRKNEFTVEKGSFKIYVGADAYAPEVAEITVI